MYTAHLNLSKKLPAHSHELWPVHFAVGSRVTLNTPHDGDFPFVGRGCWSLDSPRSLEYTGNYGDFQQEDNETRIRAWHAEGRTLYVTSSYVATYDNPESNTYSCKSVSVSLKEWNLNNCENAVVFARNVSRAPPFPRPL